MASMASIPPERDRRSTRLSLTKQTKRGVWRGRMVGGPAKHGPSPSFPFRRLRRDARVTLTRARGCANPPSPHPSRSTPVAPPPPRPRGVRASPRAARALQGAFHQTTSVDIAYYYQSFPSREIPTSSGKVDPGAAAKWTSARGESHLSICSPSHCSPYRFHHAHPSSGHVQHRNDGSGTHPPHL